MFGFNGPKAFGAAVVAASIFLASVSVQSHAQTGRVHITFVKGGLLFPSQGSGNLFYKSRRFRLDVGGIDFHAVAIARMDLAGTATNFRTIGDLIGTYHSADDASTVVSGDKVARLQNSNNVIFDLHGVALHRKFAIDLAGMTITSRGWRPNYFR